MCAYAYVFRKRPGCALIGACVLIRTNTVFFCLQFLMGTLKLVCLCISVGSQQLRSCWDGMLS